MPSAIIPTFLLGRHTSSLLITPGSVGSGGAFTPYTTSPFPADLHTNGNLEGWTLRATPTTENITAVDSRLENDAITEDGFEIEISEIRQAYAESILAQVASGFDYFRIQVNRGGPGISAAMCFAAICLRGDLTDEVAKGKNVVTLTGKPAGVALYYGTVANLPF